ncbi:MAG: M4 family metallopeptidase [Lamprobacter sp.]|uniref:M4 family metallopeptidase n=1 Tax=Lamprobacter sp. TaxID=3100796 RepID=UPI002B25AE1B|nr:M4 family metallopeptidase [Lamprobacter sp.]MEA3640126.1 M4 family metallopeptidase [Lamprobacter sp.]
MSTTRAARITESEHLATARAFLLAYQAYLRLDAPDAELVVERVITDELERTHIGYSQQYQGIPVWPAGLTVHLDPAGNVDLFNGTYIPTPYQVDIEPRIDVATAEATARATVPEGEQANLYQDDLIIYAEEDAPPRLAWRLRLAARLDADWLVLVDAHTGAVLQAGNEVRFSPVSGSGVDHQGATRPLDVWLHSDGRYYMIDTSKAMYDPASRPPDIRMTQGTIEIYDHRNQPDELIPVVPLSLAFSTSLNSGWLGDAVSAAANLSLIYDYYLERHGYSSFDDAGTKVATFVRIGEDFANAYWNPNFKIMGYGDGMTLLDTVAHEFHHGVTQSTANLEYRNQSGALNEAFSDIFGENVEAYVRGDADWVQGGDLGSPVRSLRDPGSLIEDRQTMLPYPAKASEERSDLYIDYGAGVHYNSTIASHAYYLLAAGLPDAIGIDQAERIFFRALRVHLSPRARFVDLRLATLRAAEELFGASSREAARVAEAFDAVEIYGAAPTPPPAPTPAPAGEDSTLFTRWDGWNWQLWRRNPTLGDPQSGIQITTSGIAYQKISVSRDGQTALYLDAGNHICLITPALGEPECLGELVVSAAAMSPDAQHFAVIFPSVFGNPESDPEAVIHYFSLDGESELSIELTSPTIGGSNLATVLHADEMTFEPNNRYLIYDALNRLEIETGGYLYAWSLYAVDLLSGSILHIVPAASGLQIGNPFMSANSDRLLTFEVYEEATNTTKVYTADLQSGETDWLVQLGGGIFGRPVFARDDRGLLFSAHNPNTWSGVDLYRLDLDSTGLVGVGQSRLWLADADRGLPYREADYQELSLAFVGGGSGRVVSDPAGLDCSADCRNSFLSGQQIKLNAIPETGSSFGGWNGACSGTAQCSLSMSRSQAVSARFNKNTRHRVEVSSSGDGTIRSIPAGILCGRVCTSPFTEGTSVVLKATPVSGARFVGWDGACSGDGDCTLNMSENQKVHASFEPLEDIDMLVFADAVIRYLAGDAVLSENLLAVFARILSRQVTFDTESGTIEYGAAFDNLLSVFTFVATTSLIDRPSSPFGYGIRIAEAKERAKAELLR